MPDAVEDVQLRRAARVVDRRGERLLCRHRAQRILPPRDQQHRQAEAGGDVGHGARARGAVRLGEHACGGEVREVAPVLVMGVREDIPVPGAGHGERGHPHDRRRAQQQPRRALGQAGGDLVVPLGDGRQHPTRRGRGRLQRGFGDGVEQDQPSPPGRLPGDQLGRHRRPVGVCDQHGGRPQTQGGDDGGHRVRVMGHGVLGVGEGLRSPEAGQLDRVDRMLRERVGQQGEAVVVPAEAVHEHERGSGRVPLGCAGRSRRGHRNGGVLPHGHGRPDPADGVRDGQGVPAGRPGRVAREHAGIGGRRGRAQQIAQADGRARGGGRRRDRHVPTLARPSTADAVAPRLRWTRGRGPPRCSA